VHSGWCQAANATIAAVHQISYVQAIILGRLQDASELFPVSSLEHSVILPRLLGWTSIPATPRS
jgi:undecaprenyl pyrophosphate phosphatase UppP